MHNDLRMQRKSRSLGFNHLSSRLLDRNPSVSPEPFNHPAIPENKDNSNNTPSYLSTEANDVPPSLPRNYSKRLGHKGKGPNKRPLVMKTELPNLFTMTTKQPPNFLLASQTKQISPEPVRPAQNRTGRCVAGYYLGNIDNSKGRMKSRHNSSDSRPIQGNNTSNIALTRFGYMRVSQGALEESLNVSARDHLNTSVKQQNNNTESNFRAFTEVCIHSEAARRIEGGNKPLLTRPRKAARLRNELALVSGKKEKPMKTEPSWEYLRDFQAEKSFRQTKRRANNESFQSTVETMMTEYNNENRNTNRFHSSKIEKTGPREQNEKVKNNFMRMVFRRIGKSNAASQNGKQFEESCDNRRMEFMKKMESLQGLKYT